MAAHVLNDTSPTYPAKSHSLSKLFRKYHWNLSKDIGAGYPVTSPSATV